MNNLIEAVDTAKHVMTKEQINGQKTGQSSASPFMKVNQQNPKRKSVSFNAIETIQKQGDSIGKLTSLMNELSSKLDRKDNPPNISQEYIQEETEDVDKDRIDMILEIDPIVEIELHITVVEIEETIKTEIIMVVETIGLELEIIKPIID